MQKHVNLVDLVKSFPTNIYLQNLVSIQKRTSTVKFAHLAEQSENGSISNLSTKVAAPPASARADPRAFAAERHADDAHRRPTDSEPVGAHVRPCKRGFFLGGLAPSGKKPSHRFHNLRQCCTILTGLRKKVGVRLQFQSFFKVASN